MLIPTSSDLGFRAHENTPILKIWVYHDNRKGHINQLKGLLNSLSSQAKIEETWIEARTARFHLPSLVKPETLANSPDIVLGAGHSTHKSLLFSARSHKAKSFVVMKPSLPIGLFDGVICPEHDGLKNSARIYNTQGPISAVSPSVAAPSRRLEHLFLIGGPSKHFIWDDSEVIAQIETICLSRPDINWTLSNSPRTPETFLEVLREKEIDNLICRHYEDKELGDIDKVLSSSAFTWITPDSMSMIYDSWTSGSPTALLNLPPKPKYEQKRIFRHVSKLLDDTSILGFDQWQATMSHSFYPPIPAPLNEAKKAATWMLNRYRQLKDS